MDMYMPKNHELFLPGPHVKLNSYSDTKRFFIILSQAHGCFSGHERLSYRSIQTAIPKATPLHELKKIQLQRFTLRHRILLVV